MTRTHVVIHKERGETPLAAIARWKAANPSFASLPASYAGRLDPMAEGKLLVLLGEECKKQKKYTRLDKEYEIEIVFDLATDTSDVLGLPAYTAQETQADATAIRSAVSATVGTHRVPYPAFSSRTVNGKQLFLYALEGTLGTIQIPEHDETIYKTKVLGIDTLPTSTLRARIEKSLERVPRSEETSKRLGADFRQDLIRAGWRALFEHLPEREFLVLKLRVSCASGTYMRTLAGRISSQLGTEALALSIRRTKIGTYKKFGPLRMWTKQY